MKELSIEEKAKAYDEVVEKAKNCLKDGTITNTAISYIETLIPELKECEDEKIRRCIGMCLTDADEQRFKDFNTNLKDCLIWLEKQGEHANFRNKIQIGDKVTRNEYGVLVNLSQLNRVAKKQGEQKLTEFEKAVKQVMEEAIECGNTHNLKADAEMLLSLVHKSAWSDEDEKQARQIERIVHDGCTQKLQKQIADWLKSLKERCNWKPSDEQMIILRHVISGCSYDIEPLVEIEEQLKKLREE